MGGENLRFSPPEVWRTVGGEGLIQIDPFYAFAPSVAVALGVAEKSAPIPEGRPFIFPATP